MNTDSRRERNFKQTSYYQLVKKTSHLCRPASKKEETERHQSVSPREIPLQVQRHPHRPGCLGTGEGSLGCMDANSAGAHLCRVFHACRDGTFGGATCIHTCDRMCAGARRCCGRPHVSGRDVRRASPGQAAALTLGCQLTGRLLRIS